MRSFKMFITSIFIIALFLVGCSDKKTTTDNNNEESQNTNNSQDETIAIGSLEIGDKVVDPSWQWEFRTGVGYTYQEGDVTAPVVWIVVAKDHYSGDSVTLLAENLIGRFPYDTSTLQSGLLAGWNHWGDSGTGNAQQGIRPWLNSTGIHEGEGFYTSFSGDFASIVLATEVPNIDYEFGIEYTTTDNVFIPSGTELGDTDLRDTYSIGTIFDYFSDSDDQARTALILNDYYTEDYWLRNPISLGYRAVGMIAEYGFFTNNFADFNDIGVRPLVNVSSNVKLNPTVNDDGVYSIVY